MLKPTIGLEIHTELKTRTKMFCGCLNAPDEKKPNANVCPVCMGHPGTLPVINREAVRMTVKTGLALGCEIPEVAKFDRKNYFYPDLPKGYQISQYDQPFCVNGHLEIEGRKIRIRRVHLEEDTGKLIHPKGASYSLVDFNRAGVPLMELVTEPDISSGIEARKFAQELWLILRYLGVSDADMEKGQMRVEVNISLSENKELGTKVEIKNLNSFKAVEKGIDFEIERQARLLEQGKKIIQETRGWDDNKGETISQREKEEAQDYRYFPEPDLPLHHFKEAGQIEMIKSGIPELPQQKRERFNKEYGLDSKNIEVFIQNRQLGEYFEKAMSEFSCWLEDEKRKEDCFKAARFCANYLITDLQGLMEKEFDDKDFIITPENFAEYITLILEGKISSKIAKMVLSEMYKTGGDPSQIIEEKGWTQIDDSGEVEKIIQEVIAKNQKAVEDFKKGKENAFQFLVGQVMAQSRGKAKPDTVRELLKGSLEKM